MSEHLNLEQIEQYVQRVGSVDEILRVAEHLEACDECRDLAAGIVDLQTTVEGGERPKSAPASPPSSPRRSR